MIYDCRVERRERERERAKQQQQTVEVMPYGWIRCGTRRLSSLPCVYHQKKEKEEEEEEPKRDERRLNNRACQVRGSH